MEQAVVCSATRRCCPGANPCPLHRQRVASRGAAPPHPPVVSVGWGVDPVACAAAARLRYVMGVMAPNTCLDSLRPLRPQGWSPCPPPTSAFVLPAVAKCDGNMSACRRKTVASSQRCVHPLSSRGPRTHMFAVISKRCLSCPFRSRVSCQSSHSTTIFCFTSNADGRCGRKIPRPSLGTSEPVLAPSSSRRGRLRGRPGTARAQRAYDRENLGVFATTDNILTKTDRKMWCLVLV